MKNTLVLLTKHYPYGKSETYLNNEIPFLTAAFDELIIVPVEEFEYTDINLLCSNNPKITALQINKNLKQISIRQRLQIQFSSLRDLFREITTGRESLKHIRQFRMCFVYSKLAYTQAIALHYLLKEREAQNHFTFYSYWLHKSVLLLNGLKALGHSKIKIVSRAHSSDLYHKNWADIMRLKGETFMPFEKTKLKACDTIYTISQHGLNHLKKHFSSQNHKFKLSRLGVIAPVAQSIITDWKIFRIVTCSAIQPHKRIHRIPEILSQLSDIPLEWVHFGSGSTEDEALLQHEIQKFKVEKIVNLKMHVNHDEIMRFYSSQQVNLIINLSYAEGIPVSLMEAIGCGIPGIATQAVGNPEIIDSSCGFTVPVDFKAEEVSELIRKMYVDPELQMTLRKGARAMFEERYSAEKNYTQFASFLKS